MRVVVGSTQATDGCEVVKRGGCDGSKDILSKAYSENMIPRAIDACCDE